MGGRLFHLPTKPCNLRGHLQRCQMPDIESSRKTAEKGAEWVTVKQPKNSRKNSRNTRKTVKIAVFRVFRMFFRLFFGCFTLTHSAPFSAVFRLLSMSGIWHLCRWPRRLQTKHLKFRANFGEIFRENFGNFVSNFAIFFSGNFVQQRGGAKQKGFRSFCAENCRRFSANC